MEYVKLNNGVKMPILGFGVYQIPKEETKQVCLVSSYYFLVSSLKNLTILAFISS